MPTGLFLVFSAPSHFSTFFRHELQHETSHSMWSAPVKHSSPRWRKKGLCLLLLPVFYIQRMPYHHPRKTLWSQLPADLKSLFCTLSPTPSPLHSPGAALLSQLHPFPLACTQAQGIFTRGLGDSTHLVLLKIKPQFPVLYGTLADHTTAVSSFWKGLVYFEFRLKYPSQNRSLEQQLWCPKEIKL